MTAATGDGPREWRLDPPSGETYLATRHLKSPLGGAVVRAWQGALAAEERAAFGYGLLGAHLHGSPHLALAINCSDAHEALRDDTAAAIAAAGLTPRAPAADYPGLYPVTSPDQAIALAPRLEQYCASAWRYLYATAAADMLSPATGTSSQRLRAVAQRALTASALRATQWRVANGSRQASVPFPGL